MRWVFIRPQNRSPYYDPEIQEPLGLEYLAASRRSRGDATLILDVALDGLAETKLARRAAAFQPDYVGFSMTTAQELDSVRLIHDECRRSIGPRHVRWLAGGNFISTELSRALQLLPDDFVLVPFEGEHALEQLVAQREGGSPSGRGSAPAERVRPGQAVEHLDGLPFPVRPFAEQVLAAGWALNLQASRGCCGCCRFCASPGMSADGLNRWRGRSPASLAAEIESLYRQHGARSFNIVDEDFLGPPDLAEQRAGQFADELRRRELRVSFGIQVRPASLGDSVIDMLTAAGLTYVFVGIESDDPGDLKRWGRPWIADPWSLVERLRQRGAEVGAGVMLFHPHATLAGIRRFAEKLSRHRLLEFRSATNRLDAMPGSAFYREALAAGQLDREIPGPQPLPYREPAVATLHEELVLATEPLGPPSMHAICALPPLLARRFLDARLDGPVRRLQEIIATADAAVARSLFALLDLHQQGIGPRGLVDSLRRQNLEVALRIALGLAGGGFADSYEVLREAIRRDSGM